MLFKSTLEWLIYLALDLWSTHHCEIIWATLESSFFRCVQIIEATSKQHQIGQDARQKQYLMRIYKYFSFLILDDVVQVEFSLL